MQIKLDKTFPIDSSEAVAWTFLSNISGVAQCMPGAEIVETLDDTHYKGQVRTKIGPAKMAFNGDLEILNLDLEKHEMHLKGKGQDAKGGSTATMDLTAIVVKKDETHSELHGIATLTVNGKIASLGGRMMTQVADQILKQFGDNFIKNVKALEEVKSDNTADKQKVIQKAGEINIFVFGWQVFIGYIKSLFSRKSQASIEA